MTWVRELNPPREYELLTTEPSLSISGCTPLVLWFGFIFVFSAHLNVIGYFELTEPRRQKFHVFRKWESF